MCRPAVRGHSLATPAPDGPGRFPRGTPAPPACRGPGVLASALTYPFDVVRARAAVAPGLPFVLRHHVADMVRRDGTRAFFRGVVPSVAGVCRPCARGGALMDGIVHYADFSFSNFGHPCGGFRQQFLQPGFHHTQVVKRAYPSWTHKLHKLSSVLFLLPSNVDD